MQDWRLDAYKVIFGDLFGTDAEGKATVVEWCLAARAAGPVAFIGAGLTRGAKVRPASPTQREHGTSFQPLLWDELAARWRVGLEGVGENGTTDPLWLAELFQAQHSRNALEQTVREAVPDDDLLPSDAHMAMVKMRWKTVITTNYDTLIEKAFSAGRRDSRVIRRDSDIARGHGHDITPIIHAHGDFTNPPEMVITLEDYRRYRETRPGLLVKIQQLLLEHPLLVLGFGATDPNFIQWSGWVRDSVGRHHPPGLALTVGHVPSVPRQSYWGARLHFVAVQSDRLPAVLAAIAECLDDEVASERLEAVAKIRICAASTAIDVLRHLRAWLQIRARMGRDVDTQLPDELLEASIERIFAVTPELRTASTTYAAAGGDGSPPDAVNSQVDPWRHMALREARLLQQVRSNLGQYWFPWLVCVATHQGAAFWIPLGQDRVRVSIDAELRAKDRELDDATRSTLRAIVCQARVADAADEQQQRIAIDDASEALDAVGLDDGVRSSLLDAIERARFHLHERQGGPEPQAEDTQALRRRGYFAYLHGHLEDAFESYRRAAHQSNNEAEDEATEWLTLESFALVRSATNALRALGSSGRVAPQRDDFAERHKQLKCRDNPAIRGFQRREKTVRDKLLDAFWPLLARSTAWVDARTLTMGSAGQELLQWCEAMWVCPDVALVAAEARAVELATAGDFPGALRLLLLYGSARAQQLSAWLAQAPRRRAAADVAASLLTAEHSGPTSLRATVECLKELAGELPGASVAPATSALQRFFEANVLTRAVIVRGATLSFSAPGDTKLLADTLIAMWSWLPGTEVVNQWTGWRATCAKYPVGAALWSELSAQLHELPWQAWVMAGDLDDAAVDEVLLNALDALSGTPPWKPYGNDGFLWWAAHVTAPSRRARTAQRWPRMCARLSQLIALPSTFVGGIAAASRVSLATRVALKALTATSAIVDPNQINDLLDNVLNAASQIGGRDAAEAMSALSVAANRIPNDAWPTIVTLCADQLAAPRQTTMFGDDADELAPGVVALLAAVISHRLAGDDALSRRVETLLLEAISRVPIQAQAAVTTMPNLTRGGAEVLARRVSTLLLAASAGPEHTAEAMQVAGVRAVRRWIDSDPRVSMPGPWLTGLCVAARAQSVFVSMLALRAIAAAVRKSCVPETSEWTHELLEDCVIAAAGDGRAYVVGAAADALAAIEARMTLSTETAGRISSALAALADDPRIAVAESLRRARALACSPAALDD